MKPSKPRSSGPRRSSSGSDRPRRFEHDDRPRTRFDEERAAERRARGDAPRSDGPRSDRPRSDRPRRDESLTARPSRDGGRDQRGSFGRDGERSDRGPGRGFGDRNRGENGDRSFRDRTDRGPGRGGDRNRDGGYGGERGERSLRPRGPGKDPSIQVWRPEDDDIGNRDPGYNNERGHRGGRDRSDGPRDFADRPRSDRPREDRPRSDRPRRDEGERPRRDFDRPRREFADRDATERNSPRPPRFDRDAAVDISDQDSAPAKPENAQRRDETRIHGVNACKAFFAVRPQDLIRVYLTQARAPQFAEVMKHCVNERLAYHIIPDDELARAADTDHHEGVCFLVRKRTTLTVDEWLATVPAKGSRRVLALENVGNPHNLGAILRTAAHFGVDAVLINAGAPVHSGAVARTAEGGFEALTLVEYRDLPATFEKLSEAGFELIATSGEGDSGLFDQKLPKRAVIWFGEEHSGLSDFVLEHADLALKIPGSGAVQSLNVSCAVAVVLAEWMRTSSK
ncbi:MAG TPA: tRNA/rRNA methyltransferase [Permianibacter sp.]|nr:tRNA/rRNA methyltransferase [Permianibacter sp.]